MSGSAEKALYEEWLKTIDDFYERLTAVPETTSKASESRQNYRTRVGKDLTLFEEKLANLMERESKDG